jgi:hypothetical protein
MSDDNMRKIGRVEGELVGATDGSGDAAGNMYISDAFANERNTGTANQYGVGVDECEYFAWAHGDGDTLVTGSDTTGALVFGVLVTDTITGATNIEDGATDAGVVVLTVPNSAAIGTFWDLKGAKFDDGIFIDDGSSAGSLIILWRPQG